MSDLNPKEYFGFEPFSHILWQHYGPFPLFEEKLLHEDAESITKINWRGIKERGRKDMGSIPDFLEPPVQTRQDWDRYKEERLQSRLTERLAHLDQYLEMVAPVDAPLQVGLFPWGVFGTPRDLLGTEEVLLAFYTEPDLIADIMQTHVTLWLSIYEEVARKRPIDIIHLWEDMAGKNGSLISMKMVREFMMPQYQRIASFARAHDIPCFCVDSDGRAEPLFEVMIEYGVNGFWPFEVAAGCDIEAFRMKHKEIGVCGGLNKAALAKTRKDIGRELDKASRLMAMGGYVPGCDHMIPPDVSWENYKYFVTEMKKLIGV